MAREMKGVTHANWNNETKILEFSFDMLVTRANRVEVVLAKIGHDSKYHKADIESYDALPNCCKYKRELEQKDVVSNK